MDPVSFHSLNPDLQCIKYGIKVALKLTQTKKYVVFVETFNAVFWNF